MKTYLAVVMAVVMAVVIMACMDVPAGAAVREEIPDSEIVNVKSVKLNKTNVVMPVWKSVKLTKTISPKNATNKRVKWWCSNPSVIKLTQRGYVIARRPGRTLVFVAAEDRGIAATCLITVLPMTASGRPVKYDPKTYFNLWQ